MKQVQSDIETFARIKVIGVGGSGGNAVNHMVSQKVRGVEFIAVNTDSQDLQKSLAKKKIHIGKKLTRGLGTGMNPSIGGRAAEETREELVEALKGSDMVFVTCGMGGGTGTGAAPIVAKIAKDVGALTIGVVTQPFSFEGKQRLGLAQEGLERLSQEVDALVVVPNDKIFTIVERTTSVKDAFALCDEVLRQSVEGITDLITTQGIINVDFADIRAIMENAGSALMGIGRASGEKRAEEAAQMAINSPLLDVTIDGATGVLFSVTGGDDLSMFEVQEAAKIITAAADSNAKIIFGAVIDPTMKKGEIKVTVIATGFPKNESGRGRDANFFGSPRSKSADEEGKIYNSVMSAKSRLIDKDDSFAHLDDDEDLPPLPKESSRYAPTQRQTPAAAPEPEDTNEWGGSLPSFLRRSRLK